MNVVLESAHPYAPLTNELLSATIPGAAQVYVTFDPRTEVERDPFDFIFIYDGAMNPIGDPLGYSDRWLAGRTLVVPGNTARIRLTSDGIIQFYGYKAVVSNIAPDALEPIYPVWNNASYVMNSHRGVYSHHGALFVFDTPNISVYKSVDGGQTWATVDDANRPLTGPAPNIDRGFGTRQVSANIVKVLYIAQADNLLRVQEFDLATELWSTISNPGPTTEPNTYIFWWLEQYPTGEVLCVFHRRIGGHPHAFGVILSAGGVWGAVFDISINVGILNYETACTMLAGTRAHVIYRESDNVAAPGGINKMHHRSILADGTMSADQDIAIAVLNVGDPTYFEEADEIYAVGIGASWLEGATYKIAVPFQIATVGLSMVIADSADVPVWAVETISDIPPGDGYGPESLLVLKGGILHAAWRKQLSVAIEGQVTSIGLLYAERTAPGVWTSPVIGDRTNQTYTPGNYVYAQVIDGSENGVLNSQKLAPLNQEGLWFQDWPEAPVPPPPPASSRIDTGTRRMVVLVPNSFDCCLWQEIPLYRRLPFVGSVCCLPEIWKYFAWEEMPADGRVFRQTGAIPTPAPIDGDVLVFQFRVPLGYDAVIRSLFNHYTGPGFLDGSGDIVWRLQLNQIYAKHLGNLTVQLGDIDSPSPMVEAIIVPSNKIVRYIVNVPNLSGGILIGNSQIVCGVEGWLIPRAH